MKQDVRVYKFVNKFNTGQVDFLGICYLDVKNVALGTRVKGSTGCASDYIVDSYVEVPTVRIGDRAYVLKETIDGPKVCLEYDNPQKFKPEGRIQLDV